MGKSIQADLFGKVSHDEAVDSDCLENRLAVLSAKGIKVEYMKQGNGNAQWIIHYRCTPDRPIQIWERVPAIVPEQGWDWF